MPRCRPFPRQDHTGQGRGPPHHRQLHQVKLVTGNVDQSYHWGLFWTEFSKKLGGNWRTFLRKDADFCDVTLVCKEDKQIKSHRIILSAGSPFFSTVLKKISTPIQWSTWGGLRPKTWWLTFQKSSKGGSSYTRPTGRRKNSCAIPVPFHQNGRTRDIPWNLGPSDDSVMIPIPILVNQRLYLISLFVQYHRAAIIILRIFCWTLCYITFGVPKHNFIGIYVIALSPPAPRYASHEPLPAGHPAHPRPSHAGRTPCPSTGSVKQILKLFAANVFFKFLGGALESYFGSNTNSQFI